MVETWTRVTSLSCSTPGDLRDYIKQGTCVIITQAANKYFVITNVTYSAPNTVVTLFGGGVHTLDVAPIVHFKRVATERYYGFPDSVLQVSAALAGLVPALSGDTTEFLRGDGTWASITRGPSATVFKNGTIIKAIDPAGNLIASGVSNTNDAYVINIALALFGRVFLCSGDYYLETALLMPTQSELCGEYGKTILYINVNNASVIENLDPSGGNTIISIHDLIIDGNKATKTGAGECIHLTKCTQFFIYNNIIRNARGNNIRLTNNGDGIIHDNQILASIGDCIYLDHASDTQIHNNAVGGSTTGNGIFVLIGSGCIIEANPCYVNYGAGIYISGGNAHQLTGNRCNSNTDWGIILEGCVGCKVDGGIVVSNVGGGISLRGGATRCTVQGAMVSSSGANAGIWVQGTTTTNNGVIGCTCWDDQSPKTQPYGVRLVSGDYNRVLDCDLSGNLTDGLNVLTENTHSIWKNNIGATDK